MSGLASQIFGQIFFQPFGLKHIVRFYWDHDIQCTGLLGQNIQEESKKTIYEQTLKTITLKLW